MHVDVFVFVILVVPHASVLCAETTKKPAVPLIATLPPATKKAPIAVATVPPNTALVAAAQQLVDIYSDPVKAKNANLDQVWNLVQKYGTQLLNTVQLLNPYAYSALSNQLCESLGLGDCAPEDVNNVFGPTLVVSNKGGGLIPEGGSDSGILIPIAVPATTTTVQPTVVATTLASGSTGMQVPTAQPTVVSVASTTTMQVPTAQSTAAIQIPTAQVTVQATATSPTVPAVTTLAPVTVTSVTQPSLTITTARSNGGGLIPIATQAPVTTPASSASGTTAVMPPGSSTTQAGILASSASVAPSVTTTASKSLTEPATTTVIAVTRVISEPEAPTTTVVATTPVSGSTAMQVPTAQPTVVAGTTTMHVPTAQSTAAITGSTITVQIPTAQATLQTTTTVQGTTMAGSAVAKLVEDGAVTTTTPKPTTTTPASKMRVLDNINDPYHFSFTGPRYLSTSSATAALKPAENITIITLAYMLIITFAARLLIL